MQNVNDVWYWLLNSKKPIVYENLQGLLALKPKIEESVFYNNLGVIYEKMGEFDMAKIFYLKSLGSNIMSVQTWRNYYNVLYIDGNADVSLLTQAFYFIQSNSMIEFYIFIILIFTLLWFVSFFERRISTKILIVRTFSSLFLLLFILKVNQLGFFYVLKSDADLHEGPSILFKKKQKAPPAKLVFINKENNSYKRIFIDGKAYWVDKKKIVQL